eukprot:gene450-6861_t
MTSVYEDPQPEQANNVNIEDKMPKEKPTSKKTEEKENELSSLMDKLSLSPTTPAEIKIHLETPIYIVGEGTFDFANKFTDVYHHLSTSDIHASEFRPEDVLVKTYGKDFTKNQVDVKYEVDATKMDVSYPDGNFRTIIWNAPYSTIYPFISGDLLLQFFQCAIRLQNEGDIIILRIVKKKNDYYKRYEVHKWIRIVKENYTIKQLRDSIVKYNHVFNTRNPSTLKENDFQLIKFTRQPKKEEIE